MKDALVVGLDPGITTGIAVLDAYGNVLNMYSKRNMTKGEIINHILKFGNPVVMSSDVSIVPKSVEKIATKLGCIIYSPDTSPTLDEKKNLTKEYYRSMKNDHEVDALAAAIKAWKNHRTLFSKVDDILRKFGGQEIFADIILKILHEESPNIEDAIRGFIEKEKASLVKITSKVENPQKELLDKLHKKLVEKQTYIDSLENQSVLLSKTLNELRKEINSLKERKVGVIQDEDSKKLRDSIEMVKKFRMIESNGYYPILEIKKLDIDSIDQLDERIDQLDRILMVNENDNLNLLNDRKIKCLITFDKPESLPVKSLEFPVVQIDSDTVESFDDIKALEIDYIEKGLADAKKSGLVEWLKNYRKRKD